MLPQQDAEDAGHVQQNFDDLAVRKRPAVDWFPDGARVGHHLDGDPGGENRSCDRRGHMNLFMLFGRTITKPIWKILSKCWLANFSGRFDAPFARELNEYAFHAYATTPMTVPV